jgi:hypothetical protein
VATQALNARLEHCCFRCKKVRYNQSDDVVQKSTRSISLVQVFYTSLDNTQPYIMPTTCNRDWYPACTSQPCRALAMLDGLNGDARGSRRRNTTLPL